MDGSIQSLKCEGNPEDVHNSILNNVICERAKALIPEGEQSFYAEYVFKVKFSTFSTYLNGTRAFPAWLIVAMDKAFKGRVLLDILIHAEESGPAIPRPVDPRSLTKLFVLAPKEEGVFNSMLAQGICDHFDSPDGIDQLSRETVKLAHFLAAMQERLNGLRERAKAQGKAS
jgi:hypothetical protein